MAEVVFAVAGDSISAGSPLWDPDPAVRARIAMPDERSQLQCWASQADARLAHGQESKMRLRGPRRPRAANP